jgi:hypothetical protein
MGHISRKKNWIGKDWVDIGPWLSAEGQRSCEMATAARVPIANDALPEVAREYDHRAAHDPSQSVAIAWPEIQNWRSPKTRRFG